MFSGELKKSNKLLSLSIIILIVLIIYGGLPKIAAYVWDDDLIFISKTSLLNQPISWKLLMEPVLPGTSYFRPVVMLTWFLEFHWFGQSAFVSHIINITIFSLNCLLVYLMTANLAGIKRVQGDWRPLLAGILYAVHPALAETTSWVSGRFDQLVTFWVLAGLVIITNQSSSRNIAAVLACFCYAFAIGSKESGFLFPLIALFVLLAITPASNNISPFKNLYVKTFKILRDYFMLWCGLLITGIVCLCIRYLSTGAVYVQNISGAYYEDILTKWIPLHALALSFQDVFMPFRTVSALHPFEEIDFSSTLGQLKAGFAGAFVLASVWLAVRKDLCSAWMFLTGLIPLALVLHLIPISTAGNIIHDRFLTLPLAFFICSVVIFPWEQVADLVKIRLKLVSYLLVGLIGCWCLVAAVTSYSISRLWSSDLSLWNWAFHQHPESAIARYNYLYSLLTQQRYDLFFLEIEKYRKSHGGLEVADQLLYANGLISSGDKEGMNYMEGVFYALPKFHEMADGKQKINNFPLSSLQLGGAYVTYAYGAMMFNGDAKTANKYNKIAEWYIDESQNAGLMYQKIAIYYAEGNFAKADELLVDQSERVIPDRTKYLNSINQTLSKFCEVKGGMDEICNQLKLRKLIGN